jgi:hypothetical protein
MEPPMPSSKSPAEIAERLQRRRARLLMFQGLLFLIWQANFFSSPHGDFQQLRSVDQVKISAFIVWAIVLLIVLATGGGWFRSKEVRALLADETTVAHRRSAFVLGYWAAMLAAIGLYVLSLFEPVRLVEAIHIVLSAGIIVPLLRFAQLERRAAGE